MDRMIASNGNQDDGDCDYVDEDVNDICNKNDIMSKRIKNSMKNISG